MKIIKVKGYEVKLITVKDSFTRKALLFKNNIISNLKKLGLTEDDIEVHMEQITIRKAKASVEWYINGHRLYYSYNSENRFIDNLFIISKVIENEINLLLNEEKSFEDFYRDFSEEENVEEQRIKARELLGVAKESKDIEEINKKYKELAKKHHPDKDGGSNEEFKKINNAHKILKRELI
jgi:hypothetical protein